MTDQKRMIDIAIKRLTHVPFVLTNGKKMAVWSSIKEILLWCPSPGCNTVLNALKCLLGYPESEAYMHPCSQREQLLFLRQFMMVSYGTLLVDVDSVQDVSTLTVLHDMVKHNHAKSQSTEVLNCSEMLKQIITKYANTSFKIPMDAMTKKHFLPAVRRVGMNKKSSMSNDDNGAFYATLGVQEIPKVSEDQTTGQTLVALSLLADQYPSSERFLQDISQLYLLGRCRENDLASMCQCTIEEGIQLTRFLASQQGYEKPWICLTSHSILISWTEFWTGCGRLWDACLNLTATDVCVVTLSCETRNREAATTSTKIAKSRRADSKPISSQQSPLLSDIYDISGNVQGKIRDSLVSLFQVLETSEDTQTALQHIGSMEDIEISDFKEDINREERCVRQDECEKVLAREDIEITDFEEVINRKESCVRQDECEKVLAREEDIEISDFEEVIDREEQCVRQDECDKVLTRETFSRVSDSLDTTENACNILDEHFLINPEDSNNHNNKIQKPVKKRRKRKKGITYSSSKDGRKGLNVVELYDNTNNGSDMQKELFACEHGHSTAKDCKGSAKSSAYRSLKDRLRKGTKQKRLQAAQAKTGFKRIRKQKAASNSIDSVNSVSVTDNTYFQVVIRPKTACAECCRSLDITDEKIRNDTSTISESDRQVMKFMKDSGTISESDRQVMKIPVVQLKDNLDKHPRIDSKNTNTVKNLSSTLSVGKNGQQTISDCLYSYDLDQKSFKSTCEDNTNNLEHNDFGNQGRVCYSNDLNVVQKLFQITPESSASSKVANPETQDVVNPESQDVVNHASQDIVHPVSQDVVKPVSQFVVNPASQDVVQPVKQDVVKPASQFVVNPASQDVVKPVKQDVVKPVKQDVVKPVKQDVVKPVKQDVVKPVKQDVVKPVKQDVVKPVKQDVVNPASQDVVKPVKQDVVKPVKQNVVKPVKQDVVKPVKQDVVKPVKQDVDKPVKQDVNPASQSNQFSQRPVSPDDLDFMEQGIIVKNEKVDMQVPVNKPSRLIKSAGAAENRTRPSSNYRPKSSINSYQQKRFNSTGLSFKTALYAFSREHETQGHKDGSSSSYFHEFQNARGSSAAAGCLDKVQSYGSSSSSTPDAYDEFARKSKYKQMRLDSAQVKTNRSKPLNRPKTTTLCHSPVRNRSPVVERFSKPDRHNHHSVGYTKESNNIKYQCPKLERRLRKKYETKEGVRSCVAEFYSVPKGMKFTKSTAVLASIDLTNDFAVKSASCLQKDSKNTYSPGTNYTLLEKVSSFAKNSGASIDFESFKSNESVVGVHSVTCDNQKKANSSKVDTGKALAENFAETSKSLCLFCKEQRLVQDTALKLHNLTLSSGASKCMCRTQTNKEANAQLSSINKMNSENETAHGNASPKVVVPSTGITTVDKKQEQKKSFQQFIEEKRAAKKKIEEDLANKHMWVSSNLKEPNITMRVKEKCSKQNTNATQSYTCIKMISEGSLNRHRQLESTTSEDRQKRSKSANVKQKRYKVKDRLQQDTSRQVETDKSSDILQQGYTSTQHEEKHLSSNSLKRRPKSGNCSQTVLTALERLSVEEPQEKTTNSVYNEARQKKLRKCIEQNVINGSLSNSLHSAEQKMKLKKLKQIDNNEVSASGLNNDNKLKPKMSDKLNTKCYVNLERIDQFLQTDRNREINDGAVKNDRSINGEVSKKSTDDIVETEGNELNDLTESGKSKGKDLILENKQPFIVESEINLNDDFEENATNVDDSLDYAQRIFKTQRQSAELEETSNSRIENLTCLKTTTNKLKSEEQCELDLGFEEVSDSILYAFFFSNTGIPVESECDVENTSVVTDNKSLKEDQPEKHNACLQCSDLNNICCCDSMVNDHLKDWDSSYYDQKELEIDLPEMYAEADDVYNLDDKVFLDEADLGQEICIGNDGNEIDEEEELSHCSTKDHSFLHSEGEENMHVEKENNLDKKDEHFVQNIDKQNFEINCESEETLKNKTDFDYSDVLEEEDIEAPSDSNDEDYYPNHDTSGSEDTISDMDDADDDHNVDDDYNVETLVRKDKKNIGSKSKYSVKIAYKPKYTVDEKVEGTDNTRCHKKFGSKLKKIRKKFQKKLLKDFSPPSKKERYSRMKKLVEKEEISIVREYFLNKLQETMEKPDQFKKDNLNKKETGCEHLIYVNPHSEKSSNTGCSSSSSITSSCSESELDLKPASIMKRRKKKKSKQVIAKQSAQEEKQEEKQTVDNLAAEGFIKKQKLYYDILKRTSLERNNNNIGIHEGSVTGISHHIVEVSEECQGLKDLSEVIEAVPVHGERPITKAISDAEKALEGTGSLDDLLEYQSDVIEDINNQCRYQMVEDEDHIQLGGIAYFKDYSLPFIYINGYKYTPQKDVLQIFTPECCPGKCTLPRKVLQKYKKLMQTFSTWEQVYKLELIKMKIGPAIMTGDLLVKLDCVISCLPELIQEIVKLHHGSKLKSSQNCNLDGYYILLSKFK